MTTAKFNGKSDQLSPAIDVGHSRQVVFPGGQAIKITDEVAQVILKSEHAKDFEVLDAAGKPVAMIVDPEPPLQPKKTEKSEPKPKPAPIGR